VYEILADHAEQISEHGKDLGTLKDLARESKAADATIIAKMEEIKATDRHAFTKLAAALATTAITVIGGQRLLAPTPPPPQVTNVPARSKLDVQLDVCRPMAPGPSREECFARVTSETDH